MKKFIYLKHIKIENDAMDCQFEKSLNEDSDDKVN